MATAPAWDVCDVVIKAADDVHEVTVHVPLKATLQEVKQALAKQIDRPEVMLHGRFVMVMPNGDRKPAVESQKLGPRRNLFFEGAPLFPKPEEKPILSLDDYDPFDEECIIESPRTLKACEMEGVDPEELFYVPLRAHVARGLSKRLVRLRHDFFEAYRQDTVDIVRRARNSIIGEDAPSWDMSVTQFGGNWGGTLSPQQYPLTHSYFEELRSLLTLDSLYERPKALPGKRGSNNRWTPGGTTKWEVDQNKPAHILMYLTSKDADLDTDDVEWACEDCDENLKKLMKLPAGKGEQVVGLPKRAQNMVTAQIPGERRVLRRRHRDVEEIVKNQVAIAEAQIDNVNWLIEDIQEAATSRLQRFRKSMPQWETELQRENSTKSRKRGEKWHAQREFIHQTLLDEQDSRNEKLQEMGVRDNEWERRIANMRALTKVHFARTWTDRRTNWGRNSLSVNKGMEAFNGAILHKQKEADLRVEDQRQRVQCLIDFKKEFKFLRKALTDLAAQRERNKQDARRQAISEEFLRMADEASDATRSPSRSLSRALDSSFGTSRGGSTASPSQTRGPRFDFGRFGAEHLALSPVSTRTIPKSWSSPSLNFQSEQPTMNPFGLTSVRALDGSLVGLEMTRRSPALAS